MKVDKLRYRRYNTIMTPQERADYKMRWMATENNSVRLHSDLDAEGKTWCRRNLERHQWSMTTWTYPYEHTFFFELKEHAEDFSTLWPDYTNTTRDY